ncbi:hypothetical protein [Psychroserpens damuponensis]|uniref:hypothetical protein n=1 Tax=Psychroserpens damuponensis TaxID=943936 RepID=UPI00058D0148|nr:hypothetical protein [Psychroserpens damuponensis]
MKQKKLDDINTSGFKVPKDYFSQVEEQILSDTPLKNKVEHSGFDIPDSYFDTLEERIFESLDTTQDTKVIPLINWKKVIYGSAIAASLVLMFNVFYNASEELTFDSLDLASIEDYIADENFTSYELSQLLTYEELSNDNFLESEITQDQLKDYLLNSSNIEDLIIE